MLLTSINLPYRSSLSFSRFIQYGRNDFEVAAIALAQGGGTAPALFVCPTLTKEDSPMSASEQDNTMVQSNTPQLPSYEELVRLVGELEPVRLAEIEQLHPNRR